MGRPVVPDVYSTTASWPPSPPSSAGALGAIAAASSTPSTGATHHAPAGSCLVSSAVAKQPVAFE